MGDTIIQTRVRLDTQGSDVCVTDGTGFRRSEPSFEVTSQGTRETKEDIVRLVQEPSDGEEGPTPYSASGTRDSHNPRK